MKLGKSQEIKAVKASAKSNLKAGSIGVKNSFKKANKQDKKARGCSEESLTGKENRYFPFEEPVRMCPELLSKDTFPTKKKEALERKLHPVKALTSSAKIKLELFPVNKETRTGLEKDGHHPYLELTLSGRKKISSVLKHLQKKWGSSNIAKGEPVLFPYHRMENLSDRKRWTINDEDTTAAAVYAAVGNPEIFRLRYGWFNILEPTSIDMISTPIPYESDVQSEGIERHCNANLDTSRDERDSVQETKEYKVTDVCNVSSDSVAQNMDNAFKAPLDNETGVSCSLQQPSMPWVDSSTNISVGALLSEASLLGKFDSKLFGSIQTCQLITDSLDAFLTSRISHPPDSRPPAEDLRTSILDAEETCHAFPLRKLSSSADVQTASRKEYSVACSQDVSLNSLKWANTDKVNDQDGLPQNHPFEKPQTDLLLSAQDERSLGLTGISWNESMGPFDLGIPVKKLTGGDSLSSSQFFK